VAAVLGSLFGIVQAGAWSCWMRDVFDACCAQCRWAAQLSARNQDSAPDCPRSQRSSSRKQHGTVAN